APAKAGIAAVMAIAAAAGLAWAMAGDPEPVAAPKPSQPVVTPVAPQEPAPPAEPEPAAKPVPPVPPAAPASPAPEPVAAAAPAKPVPKATPTPEPTPPASPSPEPPRSSPSASPKQTPKPTPKPTTPRPTPKPTPSPEKPAPPTVYQVDELDYGIFGDGTKPEVSMAESGFMWQRRGLSTGGTRYPYGVSVHAPSSLVIDLNRQCTRYDAVVGIDDLSALFGMGGVRFSVYGDGQRLWRSGVIEAGDPPVPVHVDITGRSRIRLVVEETGPLGRAAIANWAESRISCS
ncbi:NPCBM/NEW2 domain-containing protein, partial [Streptomyces cinereoruber]|uniref:NPCBM/NEW2 domain-containing protein n=1 Tax=Streptomyces cinereoruber TaxID=67260 RepID=UPI003EBF3A36